MAISVQYKQLTRRYSPNMVFNTDADDAGNITFNFAGEIGSDTVLTAETTVNNVSAGAPSISGNVVTVNLSNFPDNVRAKVRLKMTTASGAVYNLTVRFSAIDYYNLYQDEYWGCRYAL